VRDEQQLFLERVEREDQSLTRFRQIGELRLQGSHIDTLEMHDVTGAIDGPPRRVHDHYVTRDGLKPVDDLWRKGRNESSVARGEDLLIGLRGIRDDARRQIALRRCVKRDVVIDGVVARREHGEEQGNRDRDQSSHESRGELHAR